MSTLLALNVETKGQITPHTCDKRGLISCEVVVTESTRQLVVQLKPNEHVMRLRHRKRQVAICHSQRAYVANPTVHHRTTNVPQNQVSNELCKSMINFLEKFSFT